jgi:Domain of unknown function (DUF6647)
VPQRTMFAPKVLFYCSLLFAVVLIELLPAQEIATLPLAIEPNRTTAQENPSLKQTEREDLLIAIENWLSSDFELAKIDRHPRIEFVVPSQIASLHYKKFLSDSSNEIAAAIGQTTETQQQIVSLYDDLSETIYLPMGWTGSTDVEVSIVVHEMVHHFQNLLGLKYPCAQEREKLAYMAQDRWLGQSGHSLASDFDLDPFSLLVTTTCKY